MRSGNLLARQITPAQSGERDYAKLRDDAIAFMHPARLDESRAGCWQMPRSYPRRLPLRDGPPRLREVPAPHPAAAAWRQAVGGW
jgi:hypothetical protein